MSFKFFRARTLILVLAFLAGTSINSPGLKGLGTPLRAGLAGTCFRSIFTRPGMAKTPGPLFAHADFLISVANASITPETSFFDSPVASAMLFVTSDFDGAFFEPDAAAFAIVNDPPCGFFWGNACPSASRNGVI